MPRVLPTGDPSTVKSTSHKGSRIVEEVRELEQVARKGESPKTPLILLADAWVVSALAFVVMLALVLLAYRLAG